MDCVECGNEISSNWQIQEPETDVCQGCHEVNEWLSDYEAGEDF